ncbi:MAG: DUF2125 domain-containing protein [Thalassobaculaceae bacterium]|nr:DUF2125 domain-containing protein [Thalassobaculaceae bacterium]
MIACAVVAFLAIGWSIGWVLLSIHLRASIDGWMDYRRAVGDRLTHGDRTLDGFPFAIRFTYVDINWTRVDGPRTLTTATDELLITARPWEPFLLRLSSAGPVTGSWQAPSLTVSMTAVRAEAAVGFTPTQLDHLELDLHQAVAVDRDRRVIARAARLVAQVDPTPGARADDGDVPATLQVALAADALEPIGLLTSHLPFEGPADGRIRAVVRGPLPISLDPASLALWRDAGGVIDVDHLGLNWRPMDLTADGTVTLDGLLRPEGAASAEIRGVSAMIDRAVDRGLLTGDMATLLRLATAAFSRTGSDGGSSSVRAPVTIQDGYLAIGPIKILRVPSLVR